MSRKVFCIVDPNLRDLLGHHFEYDYSMMEPARRHGYEFLVLGHKLVEPAVTTAIPVNRAFSHDIWDTFSRVAKVPKLGRKFDIVMSNLRFYSALRSRLSIRTVTSDWVVFGHMITLYQLLGWVWWLRSLPPQNLPQVVLLFRYAAEWFANTRFTTYAFELLERASARDRVRIGSDSERLARDYAQFTRLPIEIFPIPHTTHPIIRNPEGFSSQPSLCEQICLVSLGNARDEKGFLEILLAIIQLRNSGQLDRFKFILQSNNLYAPSTAMDVLSAIAEIKSFKLDNVCFIDKVLSTEAYYRLLREADVVLLPYWRSIYASRTSGIFAETLAAGKIPIVTENTWMSDQVRKFGSGAVCRDRDPCDLVRTILEIEAHLTDYVERARLAKDAWVTKHNPETLVEALVIPARRPKKPDRVAVLYPWGDLLDRERQSGGSHYLSLLTDFLKEQYSQIWILGPGDWPDIQKGNVRYLAFRSSRLERIFLQVARALYRLLFYLMTLGKSRHEDIMLWLHCSSYFERTLVRRIEEVVRWADVVLLEYTFWAGLVKRACQRRNKKMILTNHDVVSNQVTRSDLLKRLTLRAELNGLRKADHVVCVSAVDQQTFRKYGVDAGVVPPAVDTLRYWNHWSKDFIHESLKKFYGIQIPGKNVVLFVGSYFSANIEAAQAIRQIAYSLTSLVAGDLIHCIVVGGCALPEKNGNFIALGKVKAVVLSALYHLADLVLIPLPYGTGASVKTIEAMACGKPILGTQVAFRGYPVVPGIHCEISDNLAEYPKLITDLLCSPDRLQELSRNARKFAEAYDYRRVYQRYVQLIDGV